MGILCNREIRFVQSARGCRFPPISFARGEPLSGAPSRSRSIDGDDAHVVRSGVAYPWGDPRIRRAKTAPRSVSIRARKDVDTPREGEPPVGAPFPRDSGPAEARTRPPIPHAHRVDAAKDDPEVELSDGVTLDRKAELASVVKFAVPLLATNIVTPLLTMTDTAFVGRCAADSVVQLAALGVSTPLTDYTVSLAAFIPAGLTNIVSNGVARGEGKESLASKTYGALIVSLTLSSIVAIVLNVWPDQLLTMLKTSRRR